MLWQFCFFLLFFPPIYNPSPGTFGKPPKTAGNKYGRL
jgi:hypothetical protein